jgi:type 1 glutamine amidotransferase
VWPVALCLVCLPGALQDPPEKLARVLFLTHSAGFVHDIVKRSEPAVPALAEQRLVEAARGRFEVRATQDCGELTPAALEAVDAVVFYTTGELPLATGGREALVDWVARGGAFVGIHCASDTFYEFPPYQEMLGGVFDGHPWHQEIGVRVVDPAHPATAHLGDAFRITDEIYQFRAQRLEPLRVLLALDTSSVDASQGTHADGGYPLAWARDFGEGRVFYTALGHLGEVWGDERYLRHLLEGIAWAIDGPDLPARAPAGATRLLEGESLSAWRARDGGDAPAWKLADGVLEVAAGTGDLVSRTEFGDALLHVEFLTPSMPDAAGQARGNSGVYVQGRYEVQVLDSHGVASGLGDCAAIYGKQAPAVNACRQPGRWQSYDIVFTAPRFHEDGAKSANARMTVWHNGRLVHDDVEVDGPTGGATSESEVARGPLLLQDHGNPVRYRAVWVEPR